MNGTLLVVLLFTSVMLAPSVNSDDRREGSSSYQHPMLISSVSIDADVRSIAEQYVNYILPIYPNAAYQDSVDNGFTSDSRSPQKRYLVPNDLQLMKVLAALQGYTRFARNESEMLKGIQLLKNASKSGGYMPTIAGNPAILFDLKQLNIGVKLPTWEIIVGSVPFLADSRQDRVALGSFIHFKKLETGFGSVRQIRAWIEEIYVDNPQYYRAPYQK